MVECIICKNGFEEIDRNVAISDNRHKICSKCLKEKVMDVLWGEVKW